MFQESSLGLCECHPRLSLLCDLAALDEERISQDYNSKVPLLCPIVSVNDGLCTFKTKSRAPEARAAVATRKKMKWKISFFSPR